MCNFCEYAGTPTYKYPCSECVGFRKFKVKNLSTNADRIRSMSDEELAIFLCEKIDCYSDGCPGIELCKPNEGKANGILKWLKHPAEKPKEGE